MISKLSTKLTEQLFRKGLIGREDKDLYEYAFFVMGSHAFFFLTSLIIGSSVNIPIEAMVFYLSFCCVRRFAGGIHADSETKCILFTILSIIFSVLLIKTFNYFSLSVASICIMVISVITVILISPVDTPNKRIDQNKKRLYRKKTILFTIINLGLFACMNVLKKYNIAIALSIGMSLAAILLILGKFEEIKQNCKE